MGTVLIIVLVVVALIVLYGVLAYNGMVRSRNMVDEAWSGIDVQLKRRHDLIPNLVETVKGYAAHERGVFDEVARARSLAASPASGPAEQAAHENVLTQAIGRLFAVAEAYPQLRATENFQQLQAQLADVEQNIAIARQVYNDTVLSYENALETVPTSIIAGWFNFRPREYFQTEDATREAPRVDFGQGGGTVAPPPAAPPAETPPPAAPPASEPPAS